MNAKRKARSVDKICFFFKPPFAVKHVRYIRCRVLLVGPKKIEIDRFLTLASLEKLKNVVFELISLLVVGKLHDRSRFSRLNLRKFAACIHHLNRHRISSVSQKDGI